jgi:hypothetical protein
MAGGMPIPDLNLNSTTSAESGDIYGGGFSAGNMTFTPKKENTLLYVGFAVVAYFIYKKVK